MILDYGNDISANVIVINVVVFMHFGLVDGIRQSGSHDRKCSSSYF